MPDFSTFHNLVGQASFGDSSNHTGGFDSGGGVNNDDEVAAAVTGELFSSRSKSSVGGSSGECFFLFFSAVPFRVLVGCTLSCLGGLFQPAVLVDKQVSESPRRGVSTKHCFGVTTSLVVEQSRALKIGLLGVPSLHLFRQWSWVNNQYI